MSSNKTSLVESTWPASIFLTSKADLTECMGEMRSCEVKVSWSDFSNFSGEVRETLNQAWIKCKTA